MLQQINTINHPQTIENPQNQVLSQSRIEAKKKKKKFKIKKYIKSPNKHHPFTTNNPLYEALNDQDIINTNQLNFGPWIKEQPKPKDQFFPTLDKKQPTHILKNQQNPSKQTTSLDNKQMSKSQQLLTKFNSLTSPSKLEKVSNRNSTYFKVPVWNAFIEQRTISVSTNNPTYSFRKEMMKERQTSVNFEIKRRKPNLNLVSIGSTEDLKSQRKIKFNGLNREGGNFSSTKMERFHGYSTTKLDLLKKIKANAVVYNYCCENESRMTSTLQNIQESEERLVERKVENNLKRKKHEIFQRKLNEMELKLVVPEEKSKLVFLPHSERMTKAPVSKYIFMDLLQMRANAK